MMGAFEKQLRNYRLTTAEIIYRLPDHFELLQSYIWQDLDLLPDLPVLTRFLTFWEKNLDGRLHTVKVASVGLVRPAEIKFCKTMLTLH